jgi:hypothetical protein
MGLIRVIVKEPQKDAYVTDIPNTLEGKQKVVGGYIEVVPFGIDHLLILNEEGKLIGLQPNIVWNDDVIMGTIILVRNEAPEFGSIRPEEENWMLQMLNRASV